MAVSDLFAWNRPQQKWESSSATTDRHQRKKDRKDALEAAYEAVDARDKGICWVTGRLTVKGGTSPEHRRERHHLKGRNVRPDWRDKPERIITVSGLAHKLITVGKIEVEGDDARKAVLFHWNCPPKERPFQIIAVRERRAAREQAAISEDEE